MATKFGKWQVVRSLDEGGQGYIYLVRDSGTEDRPENYRILKRLKNKNRIGRFERELSVCLALDHPNIVKIVGHDLDNDPAYFVSEYYAGGSLQDAKRIIKDISLQKKLDLFLNICKAVAYAHRNSPRIIHRDLKPDNIFLRGPGLDPVIGDFGICYKDEGERFTLLEEAVGPRFYMAPELADGKAQDVQPQCDVYSLGKMLYWIVSGGVIFDREEHKSVDYDLSKTHKEPAFSLINYVLDKMIVKEPSKRIPDAFAIVDEIERLIKCINLQSHYIDVDAPQICSFCGIGQYQAVFDFTNQEIRKTRREVGSLYSEARKWGFEAKPHTGMVIMVCDHCANVQIFQPELANRDAWRRKSR